MAYIGKKPEDTFRGLALKDTFTGDGSTVTYSINNGRNVNDILVYVNGICLVPTSDYTITNTSTVAGTAGATGR